MRWRVRVWCPDCKVDALGCFEGGAEVLEASFASKEDAEAAGERYISDNIYHFEVFDEPSDGPEVNQ